MGSSPDNDGTGRHYQTVRVRQARRDGVREKPVVRPRKRCASSNLVDTGWCAVSGSLLRRGSDSAPDEKPFGAEVMVKVCGVAVTSAAGV